MKNKTKFKTLAQEVDNDKAYWDQLEREQEEMLTTAWLKNTLEDILDDRIGSKTSTDLNAIWELQGLRPTDKSVMVYVMTQHRLGKEDVSIHDIVRCTGWTKKGVGDFIRRLIPMGMMVRTRKGYYKINDKKIF